jgi:hypothetical protein
MTGGDVLLQERDQAAEAGGYLEYPISKTEVKPTRGGFPGRRADWSSPVAREVLGPETMALLDSCSTSWEMLTRVTREVQEHKARVANHCHSEFCGICSSSEAHERAAGWVEHFTAVQKAAGLKVPALTVTFTLPRELSEAIVAREDRREVLNSLFRAVHSVMGQFSVAWVAAVHFVSSSRPELAHIHFPVFAVPVGPDGVAIPAFLERERFAERRRWLLGLWNQELDALCRRFGLGSWRSENIHVSYLKGQAALSKALHYEMRAPRQDGFIHGSGSADQLRAALAMVHRCLYPPDSKQAFRRIRPGGKFGPKALRRFFEEELGLVRNENGDDSGGEWVSEGPAVLVAADAKAKTALFLVVRTGELVRLPFSSCQVGAHGAGFRWVKGPPGSGGGGRIAPKGGASAQKRRVKR